MSFAPVAAVNVSLDFTKETLALGRLAIRERKIYLEYERSFLTRGLDVSPLPLPLQPGVRSFDPTLFNGLPGLFNDSLPDAWGRLLFDRRMRAQDVLPESLSPLDRLVHVGRNGMGALVYEPDYSVPGSACVIDLDQLSGQAQGVLTGSADDVIQALLVLNGSSAGARSKALIQFDSASGRIEHGAISTNSGFEPWLVKFANLQDGPNGEQRTLVMGEGRSPDYSHQRKAGTDAGLKKAVIDAIFDQTWAALRAWLELASTYGISTDSIQLIQTRLQTTGQTKFP